MLQVFSNMQNCKFVHYSNFFKNSQKLRMKRFIQTLQFSQFFSRKEESQTHVLNSSQIVTQMQIPH